MAAAGAKGFGVNRPDDFGEIHKALAVEDGLRLLETVRSACR
jgi:hypothetical protein